MVVSRPLDDTFKISITLKGLDGLLEMIGGVVVLFVRPNTINHLAHILTQHELSEDPHDFIAGHLLHSAGHFTRGSTLFVAVYLLSHGVAKVVLVIALFREQVWAYPGMIALLGAFIAYQLYRLYYHVTIGLMLLTLFDAFVAWLTWREYESKRETARISSGGGHEG
ncbi:MAG: DUF2127 domain-containing protein [Actinomycetota bacterium]|nr:DUF2127 domain-containing protein [Actinomycetota bacterium]